MTFRICGSADTFFKAENCCNKPIANIQLDRCLVIAMIFSALVVVGGMCWLSYGTSPATLTMHHPAMLLIIGGNLVPLAIMTISMVVYCKGKTHENSNRVDSSNDSKSQGS